MDTKAQQGDWTRLSQEATILMRKGEADAAVVKLNEALAIAENELGSNNNTVALLNYKLASAYDVRGLTAESLAFYERFLMISENVYGLDHAQVKLALNLIGRTYTSQKHYARAEKLYLDYLEKAEGTTGNKHLKASDILHSLGELYEVQAKYPEAESAYARLVQLKKQSNVVDAESLEDLAKVYAHQKKYALATQTYNEALALRETAFKPNSKTRLSVRMGTSLGAGLLGGPERANNLYDAIFSVEAGKLISTNEKLAEIYLAQNLVEQAVPFYLRVLEIKAEIGHSERLSAAITLDRIALIYRKLGRVSEADNAAQQAINIRMLHKSR